MVFYLKVNREETYVYRNLQNWIRVIESYPNGKAYILCDNKNLKDKILQKGLLSEKTAFLESCYDSKDLEIIVEHVTNERWKNAGFAHLTTFLHAKENQIAEFWNIDADDTLFCLEKERLCQLLKMVQQTAKAENIDVFSLDMWRTQSHSTHWSFGVTYINNALDWIEIMKAHCQDEGRKQIPGERNVDGFFTYLKNTISERIETFYVENLKFIHYSDDFFKRPMVSGMCQWKDGMLYFPILYYCFGEKELGRMKIGSDVIKIDLDVTEEEMNEFLVDNAADVDRGRIYYHRSR